jgi:hypothetical protein
MFANNVIAVYSRHNAILGVIFFLHKCNVDEM